MKNVIQDRGEEELLQVWTDSDWAGDAVSRRSCSGGCIMLGGNLMTHWCKTQLSVALSSGEAEMNRSPKAISEGIGVYELYQELYGRSPSLEVNTDSSACKGMVLRHGSGKVKHLTTKQLWVQGATRAYGIHVKKIPRDQNIADVLTHEVPKHVLDVGMRCMGFMYVD